MKKQTVSRLVAGLLIMAAGILSISCWSIIIVEDAYTHLPDGEITLSELRKFDPYDLKDTFHHPSDKYVPVWYHMRVKKKNETTTRKFYLNKGKKVVLEGMQDKASMNHLRTVLSDSTHLFAIGDSIWLTMYYADREDFERLQRRSKENDANTRYRFLRYDQFRTQIYKINDESLVELKREKDLRFKVYPSPAVEEVNVRVDVSKSDPGTVVLFNTRGQILAQSETYDVTQETNLKLEPYPSGTYYVQVTFKGENFVKKIIKK